MLTNSFRVAAVRVKWLTQPVAVNPTARLPSQPRNGHSHAAGRLQAPRLPGVLRKGAVHLGLSGLQNGIGHLRVEERGGGWARSWWVQAAGWSAWQLRRRQRTRSKQLGLFHPPPHLVAVVVDPQHPAGLTAQGDSALIKLAGAVAAGERQRQRQAGGGS